MKKGTRLNTVIAIVITIIMSVFAVLAAFGVIVRIAEFGSFDDLMYLLPPVPIAATVIYTVWLLVWRYPQKFREYSIFLGMLSGALIGTLYLFSLEPCSGLQCLGPFVKGLLALGIFLLIVLLLSLYYLVRVRIDSSQSKKAKIK